MFTEPNIKGKPYAPVLILTIGLLSNVNFFVKIWTQEILL